MCVLDKVDIDDVIGKSVSLFKVLAVAAFVHRDRHDALGTVGEEMNWAGGDHLAELDPFDDGG